MALIYPDRTIQTPGREYGMLVLDPVTGDDIFNARYPIFGSDITNEEPQIKTHRVLVTNSTGIFNEPATPSFSYVNNNQWYYTNYDQFRNRLIATIPHGQKKKPIFMAIGRAYVRQTMRLRYYQQNTGGGVAYNSIYNAQGGFVAANTPVGLGNPISLMPPPTQFNQFQFNNVGPIGTEFGIVADAPAFTVTSDNTNIYIRASLVQSFRHHSYQYGQQFGFRRYEKFWSDLSGSWYEFTFYILPYDSEEDIYIR